MNKKLCMALATILLPMLGTTTQNVLAQESSDQRRTREAVMREGTAVQAPSAICENRGERLVLQIPNAKVSYVAIENLAAQRVLDALADDETDKYWSFKGTVTEFRSKNYLVLEVVKRAMPSDSR